MESSHCFKVQVHTRKDERYLFESDFVAVTPSPGFPDVCLMVAQVPSLLKGPWKSCSVLAMSGICASARGVSTEVTSSALSALAVKRNSALRAPRS